MGNRRSQDLETWLHQGRRITGECLLSDYGPVFNEIQTLIHGTIEFIALGTLNMARINGWKRIGIIASVVWILCAWVETYGSVINSATSLISTVNISCDSHLAGKIGAAWDAGLNACDKEARDSLDEAITEARLTATVVAFVPVPLGWGFVYLILFLIRWVKRGFVQPV